jgi:3-oxoacyl-[acyl-carrier protein] reductase
MNASSWAIGKVALVTGGATGIGRGTVLRLAHAGASVACIYAHSADKATSLVRELTQEGHDVICLQCDIANDDSVRSMVSELLQWKSHIDILINNAGVTRFVHMDDLEGVTSEDWANMLNINVVGSFQVTRACAPYLKESKGVVVNVASIAGLMGRGSSIPYAVSKGALITLTKCLARVLAPEARVNAVAPGVVLTDWVAGQEEHIKLQTANTLLGRVAEVDDVVDAIEGFICNGGFVTGQTLIVDGGYYL